MSVESFISGFLGASSIEIIASLSGFICVYLLIKRNIWCWFFGFIQVTLFSYMFFIAKLYSDAGLHVVYIGLQIYGWWNWQHHKGQDEQLIVEKGSNALLMQWVGIALLATFTLGFVMDNYTDASFAYADAFTTSASLVAQFLLTRRYVFNWLFWIVVDVVAIYVYLQKGLYPTSLLYFTFLIMSIFGYFSWTQQLRKQLQNATTYS